MICNEKRPLEQRDRDHIIFALDTAYSKQEPVSTQMHLFDEFEITNHERNQLIMQSDYKDDEKLISLLTLFG